MDHNVSSIWTNQFFLNRNYSHSQYFINLNVSSLFRISEIHNSGLGLVEF